MYIFSGRRRDLDFQHYVESLLQQKNIEGQVLLIDLAISDDHDVSNPMLINNLLTLLRSGAVQGILLAPPCETWSQARYQRESDHDPRPLRSAEDLFGLAGLTIKEINQLETANMLLCVALRLLAVAALTGTPAILEHPAQPKQADRPTIWILP